MAEFLERGLIVGFTKPVEREFIDGVSFEVLFENPEGSNNFCRCNLREKAINGLKFAEPCSLEPPPQTDNGSLVNGVRWMPGDVPDILRRTGGRILVVIHCDLIRDEKGKSVDGNHLAPWLPDAKTGDGIAGGTFESWFVLKP